jgi:pimeloyl-ACP methyl ester carboxylesterase
LTRRAAEELALPLGHRRDGGHLVERAGYVDFSGAQLYTVLHEAMDPVARVLLVGPFASERHFSYIPWVRWARFLAARGIEALRFDYRGVGESTGVFEEMTFTSWAEDVEFLASRLKSRSPDVPLILHGLELGTLLASKIFEKGVGDALLLWAAPAKANEVLRSALSRRIAVDHAFKKADQRTLWPDYLKQLEAGQPIDVEGYRWSGRLWGESFKLGLPLGKDEESNAAWARGRPVKRVKLDSGAAPLVKGSWLGYVSLNPDLSGLFTGNFEWIDQVLTIRRGRQA